MISRRRFLQLSAAAGGVLVMGDGVNQILGFAGRTHLASAAGPIKVGIIDPLSGPYKTSSIHDVHGVTVAVDLYK
jgi:branched-chain amino acid transport system substrate-binding protein